MKLTADAKIYLALLALGLFTALWSLFAENYRFDSKMLPVAIGGLVILLAVIGLWTATRGPKPKPAASVEAGSDEDEAAGESWLSYLVHFGWIAGFLLGLYLVGFLAAMPVFLLLYSRRLGSSYRSAILSAVLITAIIYGAFEVGLDVELYRGLLFAK